MPTKTRLDPDADGAAPPAEPQGAPGLSPGEISTSGGAAPPAGTAGFIDALNALSAHLKARELVEGAARRAWGFRVGVSVTLLATHGFIGLVLSFGIFSSGGGPSGREIPAFIWAAGSVGALVSLSAFWRLMDRPLRLVPDSADRVALRHEDSPLRDRIRIAQWVLLDTAFTRFCIVERNYSARWASTLLSVSGSSAIVMFGSFTFPVLGIAVSTSDMFWVILGAFALLSVFAVVTGSARSRADRAIVRRQALQVLAFDRDFGGFLPRVERERVEGFVADPTDPSAAGGEPL
jgi:hypothetical protein